MLFGVFSEEEDYKHPLLYLISFSQIVLHCGITALKWEVIISCFTDKVTGSEVICPRLHRLQRGTEIKVYFPLCYPITR